MTISSVPTVLGVTLCAFLSGVAQADELDPTLVHIECSGPGGSARKGTGVVISPDGMVLTARHVVLGTSPAWTEEIRCTGSLGHALTAKNGMTFQSVSNMYDAALLKYPGLANAAHVQYCLVEPRHKRAEVIAAGFPLRSATGQPSERKGILATIEPDGKGLLESDAATTSGMSGGRVTLTESGGLIGIVSGVSPDPATGYPSAYAVLAASRLAPEFGQFGLTSDASLCERRERVVSPMGNSDVPWVAGDAPVPLGLTSAEGFCYLARVWGDFGDVRDSVEVTLSDDGEYILTGSDSGNPSDHGAVAECVRF